MFNALSAQLRDFAIQGKRRAVAYWTQPGGEYSSSMCRIGIFACVWYTLNRAVPVLMGPDFEAVLASNRNYQPVGLLQLWPNNPPPAWFFEMCWSIARVSTVLAIIGLFTRVSMVLSVFSGLAVFWLRWSFVHSWSHANNVVWLAAIALMFANAGGRLSVDALVARLRGKEPSKEKAYWGVLLAQFSVASMFSAAVFHKLTISGFSWVFSDSLRNHIAVTWYRYNVGPPQHVQFLIDNEWAWKSAAAANILAQSVPIFACFLIRRPWLRFACGFVFVVETIGLGVVMGFWHYRWLLLVCVFIDWDALALWIQKRVSWSENRSLRDAGRPFGYARPLFISLFLLTHLSTIALRNESVHRLYPFCAYEMYSGTAAARPYGRHQPFFYTEGEYRVLTESRASDERVARFQPLAGYLKIVESNRPELIEAKIRAFRTYLGKRIHVNDVVELELFRVIQEIPAYPDPAIPQEHRRSLRGYIDSHDQFYFAGTTLEKDDQRTAYLRPTLRGYDPQEVTLTVLCARAGEPLRPMRIRESAGRFYPTESESGAYETFVRVDCPGHACGRIYQGPTFHVLE